MSDKNQQGLIVLGLAVFFGLTALGYFIKSSVINFKQFERTVTVRGLSEQEHIADIVIWPIQFTEVNNSLEGIYQSIDTSSKKVIDFLVEKGISENEITVSTPTVTDRSAQRYGGESSFPFRFIASHTVTVYSEEVEKVREVMNMIGELGKHIYGLQCQVAIVIPGKKKSLLALPVSTLFQWRCTTSSFQ